MRKFLLFILFFLISYTIFSAGKSTKSVLNWGAGGPQYVTYATITGKSGFITTPSAYCSPMGTLMIGAEFTFSSRSTYGGLAFIPKITFTPHHMFEFGLSKDLAYHDGPNAPSNFYFDSTPFLFHYKFRFLDWRSGALAFVQDFEIVPDNSGSPSRGYSGTTLYLMFTGVTTFVGSFNFGFGKTFYFTRVPDLLFNFYASWVYSVTKLDDRLQFLIDFSNADYRAGDDRFKVANEDRAYLNAQIRGVLIKTPKFQWTLMATLYDLLDAGGAWDSAPHLNLNASIGTTFNIDLY